MAVDQLPTATEYQIGENYPGGHGFDSDFMSGGASFMHTFDTPGEYDYYCQLHLCIFFHFVLFVVEFFCFE